HRSPIAIAPAPVVSAIPVAAAVVAAVITPVALPFPAGAGHALLAAAAVSARIAAPRRTVRTPSVALAPRSAAFRRRRGFRRVLPYGDAALLRARARRPSGRHGLEGLHREGDPRQFLVDLDDLDLDDLAHLDDVARVLYVAVGQLGP